MNAVEVLAHLEAAGVKVTRNGHKLRLAPPQAIPPGLLEEARLNKAALLQMVGPKRPLRCLSCGGSAFWRGVVNYVDGTAEPGPWTCERCHPSASGTNGPANHQPGRGGAPSG